MYSGLFLVTYIHYYQVLDKFKFFIIILLKYLTNHIQINCLTYLYVLTIIKFKKFRY